MVVVRDDLTRDPRRANVMCHPSSRFEASQELVMTQVEVKDGQPGRFEFTWNTRRIMTDRSPDHCPYPTARETHITALLCPFSPPEA